MARLKALYRRPDAIPFPADNPYSEAKARLGRALFFDPRLSGGNSFACATCHNPELGWEDGLPRGIGETGTVLPRHTPTILNLAWGERFFWDGRSPSLEHQALEPPKAVTEMNQPLDPLIAELAGDPVYVEMFAAAFPDRPQITAARIAEAIATFERLLVSPPAPFDRWIAGEEDAIGPAAKRGFVLFNGKANCAACHQGWAFTDHAFHDIGLPDDDRGRGAVLGMPELDHAFKTPSLRDIARRAPYMHDGSLPSLRAVLDHYVGGIVARPTLSDDLKPVALSEQEIGDLLAFLGSLTSAASADPFGEGRAPAAAPPIAATVTEPPLHGFGAPAGAQGSTVQVVQRNKSFEPGHVALPVGGVLAIANEDSRKHNVRISHPDLDLNSGIQAPGETIRIPFSRPGLYEAFCGIHPKMKLAIEVGGGR